jgi:hypothetical protein
MAAQLHRRFWQGAWLAALLTAAAALPLQAQQKPRALNVKPPALVGGPWVNTPKAEAITLASRKGKVTLVHFWTFG